MTRIFPKLTALTIKGVLVDAKALIDHCNTHKHWFSKLNCMFWKWFSLMQELGDNTSGFNRHLKCLSISTAGMENEQNCVRAMANMLKDNRYLHRLDLEMQFSIQRDCPSLFNKYCGEYLPAPRQPFRIACRLAFLSVFRSRQVVDKQRFERTKASEEADIFRPLPLDPDVLSVIFAMPYHINNDPIMCIELQILAQVLKVTVCF